MLKNGRPYTCSSSGQDKDDALISDRFLEDIAIVGQWIREKMRKSRSIYEANSYQLKHRLYRETNVYLTDNEFKDAMLLAGHKPVNPDEIRWRFRIAMIDDASQNPNPFFKWVIKNYAGADSPEGDFAEDIFGDSSFPVFAEHDIIKRYLESFNARACEEAIETFENLWKLYQQQEG